jgi:hypothetical protein
MHETTTSQFQGRIFGIGLNKTGTTSLAQALNHLGIKTRHGYSGRQLRLELATGVPLTSTFSEYRAICDMHTILKDSLLSGRRRYLFEELDRLYPGSKFIFTSRDLDTWLDSRELHVLRNRANARYRGSFGRVRRRRWRRLWKDYHARVAAHFQDRPDDLLAMNIMKGDGWDQLCPFLNLPVPDVPFPRLNAASDIYRSARKRLRTSRRKATGAGLPFVQARDRRRDD